MKIDAANTAAHSIENFPSGETVADGGVRVAAINPLPPFTTFPVAQRRICAKCHKPSISDNNTGFNKSGG